MSQENETTEATTDAAPATASTSAALPMEQVQAMISEAVKKAHDAAFAEARRTFEGKKPKAQSTQEQPRPTAEPSMSELLQLRDSFDDAVDGYKFPSKKARGKMRDEFVSSRPSDASAWAKDYAETMGWLAGGEQNQQPSNQTQTKMTNAAPVSNPGTPAQSTVGERPVNVLSWSAEDRDAYFRQNAKVPGSPYDIRNRETHKAIRRMAEAALANTRILTGIRRG